MIQTGLANLLSSPPKWIENKRLGLLLNPASVDENLNPAHLLINQQFPGKLKALFTPQHGFFAAKQDNMIESSHIRDLTLNIPAYSLYSETRRPLPEMFEDIDILLVDIQDVGTRVYTFMYTMSYCMELAKTTGKTICVLDRPNPIGGIETEGNILAGNCSSFVGRFPMPMRHGLTTGELARLFNDAYEIGCNLKIIPMSGWKRNMYYEDTGLYWVPPSPNLPIVDSVVVYPGQVIWEGTNVSEGRGATRPFEIFGAPFIEPDAILQDLGSKKIHGAILRATAFEPGFNKFTGKLCHGFHIHVTDRKKFRPYLTTLRLLSAVISRYPDDFSWSEPPYEYEHIRQPIDLIIGDKKIRKALEDNVDLQDMEASWQKDLKNFKKISSQFYLYS